MGNYRYTVGGGWYVHQPGLVLVEEQCGGKTMLETGEQTELTVPRPTWPWSNPFIDGPRYVQRTAPRCTHTEHTYKQLVGIFSVSAPVGTVLCTYLETSIDGFSSGEATMNRCLRKGFLFGVCSGL